MFDSFRGEFGFTYYGERRTSASIDIPLAVVVYICILISIATIVAAIGIRGKAVSFIKFESFEINFNVVLQILFIILYEFV